MQNKKITNFKCIFNTSNKLNIGNAGAIIRANYGFVNIIGSSAC